MKTTNNPALVTGGGSGIGFAIAKALRAHGNKVIIVGRNAGKLEKAAAELKATPIVADITNEEDVDRLVARVKKDFGDLNVLINNAGIIQAYQLSADAGAYDKAKIDMETNFFSLVRLTEKFLPVLEKQKEAAIVNISSVVAYAPLTYVSTYSATKAALHVYTQSLRLTLEQSAPAIKVFEVFPPFVDTDMIRSLEVDKLSPDVVAEDLLNGLQNDQYEIHNGIGKDLYQLFLTSPDTVLRKINGREIAAA
jgi:uncharacterized oxidoreductase